MFNRTAVALLFLLVGFAAQDAAAYYHTPTGRWISRDPIKYSAGDPNLYRYNLSNPVRYTDPRGLNADDQYEFDVWVIQEKRRGGQWLANLPACPCTLSYDRCYFMEEGNIERNAGWNIPCLLYTSDAADE